MAVRFRQFAVVFAAADNSYLGRLHLLVAVVKIELPPATAEALEHRRGGSSVEPSLPDLQILHSTLFLI